MLQKITAGPNFNYVGTIVAGLVLTAATGIPGKPIALPGLALTGCTAAQNSAQGAATPEQSETPVQAAVHQGGEQAQVFAFKTLCAWAYLVMGMACLTAFMIPTKANHEIVKSVGLTTLGFAASIFAGLQTPTILGR